jgi:acyl-CoA synthetase (AMP-forming)/AMP-acid ligase II
MAPQPASGASEQREYPGGSPFSPALPLSFSEPRESASGAGAGGTEPHRPVVRTATLLEILHQAPPEQTAFVIPETGLRVSYESLCRQVSAMADGFAAAGIRRGDRVAIALPNGLPTIVCFLAASIAGTAAPLNPAYKHDEFLFYLKDTEARLLVCPPNGAEEARRAAGERKVPVMSADLDAEGAVRLLDAPSGATASVPASEDIALVLHTSGSTGRPKRVPLRHFNLAVSARNIANSYSLGAEDVSLCVMPLFHVHGMVASVLATLASGGTVVVPGRFDAMAFWRTVRDYRVSWYSAVPSIHQVLLARIGDKGRPAGTETLRFVRSCSTSLSPEIMHKMESVFGVPLVEAYGMTEASHQMAANPLPPRPRKPWSVGAPAGVRVSVIDTDGNHLGHDERGEVVILGPSVFKGYENNPEANASSFAQGWFRTGDEGFLDFDGYLHLTGRLKDLINRAGEKISPHQVDKVLQAHPSVAQAVTFAMPHPTLGEEVAAAVVLREPETEMALIKYCRHRMAEFECPKKLFILDSIPMTATGKIRRNAVAEALLSQAR